MVLSIKNLNISQGNHGLALNSLSIDKKEKVILQTISQNDITLLSQILNNQMSKHITVYSGILQLKDINLLKAKANPICAWRKDLIWLPKNPMDYFHPYFTLAKQFEEALKYRYNQSYKVASKNLLKIATTLGIDEHWLEYHPKDIPTATLHHLNWVLTLALKPPLLVAEEPFINFDPLARQNVIIALDQALANLDTSLLLLTENPAPYQCLQAKIYQLLDNNRFKTSKKIDPSLTPLNKKLKKENPIVSLKDVSSPLLHNINLEVKKNETILIVSADKDGIKELFSLAIGVQNTNCGTVYHTLAPRDIFYYQPSLFSPTLTILQSLTFFFRNKKNKMTTQEIYNTFVPQFKQFTKKDPDSLLLAFPNQISKYDEALICLLFALVSKPELLILENLFDFGGIELDDVLLNILKDITSNGVTSILLASTLLPSELPFTHQLAFLYKGRLIEAGSTKNVLENPAHPYTQWLLKTDVPKTTGLIEYNAKDNGCPFHFSCPKAFQKCGWSGRDLEWLLYSLQEDPTLPQDIQDTLWAIDTLTTNGLDLVITLGYNTGLSWQDFLASIEKIMKTYKPSLAEVCLNIRYEEDAIIVSFPAQDPPQEKEIKKGHRVSCFLY